MLIQLRDLWHVYMNNLNRYHKNVLLYNNKRVEEQNKVTQQRDDICMMNGGRRDMHHIFIYFVFFISSFTIFISFYLLLNWYGLITG